MRVVVEQRPSSGNSQTVSAAPRPSDLLYKDHLQGSQWLDTVHRLAGEPLEYHLAVLLHLSLQVTISMQWSGFPTSTRNCYGAIRCHKQSGGIKPPSLILKRGVVFTSTYVVFMSRIHKNFPRSAVLKFSSYKISTISAGTTLNKVSWEEDIFFVVF